MDIRCRIVRTIKGVLSRGWISRLGNIVFPDDIVLWFNNLEFIGYNCGITTVSVKFKEKKTHQRGIAFQIHEPKYFIVTMKVIEVKNDCKCNR